MPDQGHARELSALAQIIQERNRVVGIVLEAEILRTTERRLPSARAAFVIAKRCDVARDQLLRKLLQRPWLDLRPVAIMVGRSRARYQQRNRRPFDAGRDRQHRVDGADADLALLGERVYGGNESEQDQRKHQARPLPHEWSALAPLAAKKCGGECPETIVCHEPSPRPRPRSRQGQALPGGGRQWRQRHRLTRSSAPPPAA